MANFRACYQCEDRHPHCHSTCPKYLKEKADWETTKQIIAKNKEFDLDAYISSKYNKRRFK